MFVLQLNRTSSSLIVIAIYSLQKRFHSHDVTYVFPLEIRHNLRHVWKVHALQNMDDLIYVDTCWACLN